MLDIIIFSKDRPCQLEALLRSKDKHAWIRHRTAILYKASNLEYLEGYMKLQRMEIDPNALWMQENDFKADLEFLVRWGMSNPYIMFLVDDIVFKGPIVCDEVFEHFKKNEQIATLSLRLGKQIDYCYVRDRPCPLPKFLKGPFNTWEWAKAGVAGVGPMYWDYPMSVDGHVFRVPDIRPLVQELDYDCPNIFEGKMAGRPLRNRPLMLCYDEPRLVNLPLNKVHRFNNRHGTISQQHLNTEWLDGKRIALEPVYELHNNSCHCEVQVEMEDVPPRRPRKSAFRHTIRAGNA